ncbi:MAG: hypothetical protein CME26_02125 [Gemmatimonadetes bacterium]|nr:hypothetical protein [Gemmatimonadota bacterium]
MRVITGDLKGRRIPFNNNRFGNARVTSDFVKEAAFSTLGPVAGERFLDLFAGSGQIGLEAWSRGADVTLNEQDGRRYQFIKSLVEEWGIRERLQIGQKNAFAFLSSSNDDPVDVAYLDPPYHETLRETPLAQAALEAFVTSPLAAPHTRVLLQHHTSFEMPESVNGFTPIRSKVYGETCLTTYVAA